MSLANLARPPQIFCCSCHNFLSVILFATQDLVLDVFEIILLSSSRMRIKGQQQFILSLPVGCTHLPLSDLSSYPTVLWLKALGSLHKISLVKKQDFNWLRKPRIIMFHYSISCMRLQRFPNIASLCACPGAYVFLPLAYVPLCVSELFRH